MLTCRPWLLLSLLVVLALPGCAAAPVVVPAIVDTGLAGFAIYQRVIDHGIQKEKNERLKALEEQLKFQNERLFKLCEQVKRHGKPMEGDC